VGFYVSADLRDLWRLFTPTVQLVAYLGISASKQGFARSVPTLREAEKVKRLL